MVPMQHREVFREPGRFGGWPANYGLWAFGDEVGRSRGAGDSSSDGDSRCRRVGEVTMSQCFIFDDLTPY